MLLNKRAWLGEEGPRLQNTRSPRQELLNFAHDLERQGNLAQATQLYAQLEGSDEAAEKLRAITGQGGFTLARGRFLASHFVDQVTDPAALFSMLGAQSTYRILSPLLGKLPAFAAEASLFPVYHRLGDAGLGRKVDWSREQLAHDIQGSFLVLGGLKAFGHVGQRGVAWWKQGRRLQGDFLDQFMMRFLPTSAMYLGILSGHLGEQAFGLAPRQSSGQLATESLVTLTHFLGVGRLLNHLPQIHPVKKIPGRFNWLPTDRSLEGVLSAWAPPRTLPWGPPTPTATPSRAREVGGQLSLPSIFFMKGSGGSGFAAPTLWGKSILNDFLRRRGMKPLRLATYPEFVEAIPPELRLEFLKELQDKMLDSRTTVPSQLPGTILETFRQISETGRYEIAREWALNLKSINFRRNHNIGLQIFEQMGTQLEPAQRARMTQSLMEAMQQDKLSLDPLWYRVIPALTSLMKSLEGAERVFLAEDLIRLVHEVGLDLEMELELSRFLEKTLDSLEPEARHDLLWKLWTRLQGDQLHPDVEVLLEEEPTLLRRIRDTLDSSDWSALAIRLARSRFYSQSHHPLDTPKVLLGEIPFASNRARLNLLRDIFEELGFSEGALDVAGYFLSRIPPEQFKAMAAELGDKNLQALAYLQSRGLPLDPYLISEWRRAPDPDAYLKGIRDEVAEYRRGKNFSAASEHELRLAYWGLDRPADLSFERFVKELDTDAELPPVFLDRPFKARVRLAPSSHALVNKSRIREAMTPINEVRWDGTFRSYLSNLKQKQERHFRKMEDVWQSAFGDNLEGAPKGQLLRGSRQLLGALLAEKENSTLHSLAGRLVLYLAWNEDVPRSLQDRIRSLNQEGLTTEQYLEGVRALEEFYRDGLGQLENKLGIQMDQISPIRRMRRNLAEELARVPVSVSAPATEVEFIPSKNPTDQFFSHVSEDFNLKKGGAIQRPSFQLYRMVSEDSRLRGLVYLQQALLDHDKKALVMAVQPRRDWEVDQASLLQTLQRELGLIAAEEGYDYLLMTQSQGTQSSRRDMLDAISGRHFPAMTSNRGLDHTVGPPVPEEMVGPPSSYLFRENHFLVLWNKNFRPRARRRRP
ncbi:MAG: hypothetical protein R3257_00540 [bacterium]|nr:hypothetical protein [bacterium]